MDELQDKAPHTPRTPSASDAVHAAPEAVGASEASVVPAAPVTPAASEASAASGAVEAAETTPSVAAPWAVPASAVESEREGRAVRPAAVSHDAARDAASALAADARASRPQHAPFGIAPMPEVEAIRAHPLYGAWYARLEEAELNREFCLHQLPHLLDVARIAYIRVLERHLPFRKEVVYAAAILHDIGKAAQYEQGEPHEVVGSRVAREILMDIEGFDAREKTMIVAAVAQHRRYAHDATPLGKLLYEADKASRPCFSCPMSEECSWPPERKNAGVGI